MDGIEESRQYLIRRAKEDLEACCAEAGTTEDEEVSCERSARGVIECMVRAWPRLLYLTDLLVGNVPCFGRRCDKRRTYPSRIRHCHKGCKAMGSWAMDPGLARSHIAKMGIRHPQRSAARVLVTPHLTLFVQIKPKLTLKLVPTLRRRSHEKA